MSPGAAASGIKQALKNRADRSLRAAFSGLARPLHISPGDGPCLVLAPHPDDETLGCGNLIAAMTAAGREVHVVIAADGSGCRLAQFRPREEVIAIRRAEALAACAALGVKAEAVTFLGLADDTLVDRQDELARSLGRIVASLRPASVFAPFIGEQHPDHVALAAAIRAAGPGGAALYEYPIWLPTKHAARLLADSRFRRSLRIAVPGGATPAKRTAAAAYRSQGLEYEGIRIDGALSRAFLDLFLAHEEVYFGDGVNA